MHKQAIQSLFPHVPDKQMPKVWILAIEVAQFQFNHYEFTFKPSN